MTKSISLTIFLTLTFSSFAFSQINPKDTPVVKNTFWLTPQKMSPLSFLETMKIKGNQVGKPSNVTMVDSFPNNWLTKKDIDTLITLVNSNEKCNCFLNPLSSFIPNDSADIGGYAIALIKSYQQNKKVHFGLHACPKTNGRDAESLATWWTQQNKK